MEKDRIIIIGALADSLINFRGHLIKEFVSKKYDVFAMASSSEYEVISKLEKMDVAFKVYPVQRNGMSPVVDSKTLISLCKCFFELKPDVIIAYTIKPIIWGGIASRVVPDARFYAMVTGLGFAFNGQGFFRRILSLLVIQLYKLSLANAHKVIFQNPDNLYEFVRRSIVPREKCALVKGSGVDIKHFSYTPIYDNKSVIFLTIGRLLGEKGFREYAEAAQIVKKKYPDAKFQLLGPVDSSPDGLPMNEVQDWHNRGMLNYLGSATDVRPHIKASHIFVLPSYHEGMPRTVLEAMAIGRPILTTDVPGCRETVVSDENGFLVPKANASALAERMIWFVENRDRWEQMGKRSRELVEEQFDVTKVNAHLMNILEL